MRPLNPLLPATLAAVLGAGALGPLASATSGDLAGTWTSTDLDGSSQQLDVRGSGIHGYALFLYDGSATGACGGSPAQFTGSGVVDGVDLTMTGTLVCLPGGNPLRFRIGYSFVYSPGSDSLTDFSGVVWYRADTP